MVESNGDRVALRVLMLYLLSEVWPYLHQSVRSILLT